MWGLTAFILQGVLLNVLRPALLGPSDDDAKPPTTTAEAEAEAGEPPSGQSRL